MTSGNLHFRHDKDPLTKTSEMHYHRGNYKQNFIFCFAYHYVTSLQYIIRTYINRKWNKFGIAIAIKQAFLYIYDNSTLRTKYGTIVSFNAMKNA